MRTSLILLILSINLIICANIKCGKKHTDIFKQYNDKLDELYQQDTFGGNFENKCMSLGNNYRQNYIDILNKNNIKCTGLWCVNNQFSCKGAETNCYQVEHMVDQNNTPYDNCDVNILGNVIMAYGLWNMQVGQLCWTDVLHEKTKVYGKEMMCKAIANIIECNKISNSNCNIKMPNECTDKVNYLSLFLGTIILIIFVCVGVAILYKKYNNIKPEHYNGLEMDTIV